MKTKEKMKKMNQANELPEWFDGKKVEEAAFCRDFLAEHPMI